MIVNAIVARTPNGIIGINGQMPWHSSEDLKRFKQLTMGKPVIMGRKTWEGLPKKPLPGRDNIVLSRTFIGLYETQWSPNTECFNSIEDALEHQRVLGAREVFIIGGEQVYRAAELYISRIYETIIDTAPKILIGDVVAKWPIRTKDGNWQLISSEQSGRNVYNTYIRIPIGG